MTEIAHLCAMSTRLVARVLAREISRLGRDSVADDIVDTVTAILGHTGPLTVVVVDDLDDDADDALVVSHTQAAHLLDCSLRTIGRRVAAGDLDAVDRKISVASIVRYATTGPACRVNPPTPALRGVPPTPRQTVEHVDVREQHRAGGRR